MPSPSISHGQSLLWSGPDTGVQGVTELEHFERTSDLWLQSVQEELRYGKLTMDTHAFSHGKPTLLPGSAINGVATCGSEWCKKRAALIKRIVDVAQPQGAIRQTYASATMRDECAECKKERKKRILVAEHAQDLRFSEEKFVRAPAVFANNDFKYEVNKKTSAGIREQDEDGRDVLPCQR